MKYHPILKGLAIFLAAVALLTCIAGAFGIFFIGSTGLYTNSLEDWNAQQTGSNAYSVARCVLDRYLASALGGCGEEILGYLALDFTDAELLARCDLSADRWYYTIETNTGRQVAGSRTVPAGFLPYTFPLTREYPVDVTGEELESYDGSYAAWRDYVIVDDTEHYLYYYWSETYTVTVYLPANCSASYSNITPAQISHIHSQRYNVIAITAVSALLLLLSLVYLGFAAGRSADGSTLRPAALNRLPLDLCFLLAGSLCCGGAYLGITLLEYTFDGLQLYSTFLLILAVLVLLAACFVAVCFLYTCMAQGKMKHGWWWKHTVIGRVLWFLYRGLRKLFGLLPVIWRYLLIAAAMVAVPLFFLVLAVNSWSYDVFWGLLFALAVLGDIAIVCYGGYAFGVLLKGAKAMSQGNLNHKIPTRYLIGDFRRHADHLNALSGAAVLAAQKQMQSERMKTELITNVSHDIKTPLTSIINYVDLLQKPHSDDEGAQYLQVLDRQSQRLKKLIDDLMEMSKASTGNLAVNTQTLDMAETVNQALGEFSDKLTQAGLQVVFPVPEQPVQIRADGRLTWRVLSNLLSNTVKYALPGTRVYLDIAKYNGNVLLSIKNISRESLNVDAQELTERFVRGDASRNTEGSGLGLNIAQSLMELQKGRLNLLVDGDLFKVTLTFPEA